MIFSCRPRLKVGITRQNPKSQCPAALPMKSIAATGMKSVVSPKPNRGRQVRGFRHHEWIVVHTMNQADKEPVITNVAIKIKSVDSRHPLGTFKAGLLTGILMVPEYKV